MVEAGATEVTEDDSRRGADVAHKAAQPLIDLQEKLRAAVGKPKRDGRAAGQATRRSYSEVEEQVPTRLAERDAHRRQAARATRRWTTQAPRSTAALGGGDSRSRGREVEARRSSELKKKQLRDEVLEQRPPPRRPQVRRDPPDLDRGRRPAAHARLGGVHARRDAGAGHRTLGTADDEQKIEALDGET